MRSSSEFSSREFWVNTKREDFKALQAAQKATPQVGFGILTKIVGGVVAAGGVGVIAGHYLSLFVQSVGWL